MATATADGNLPANTKGRRADLVEGFSSLNLFRQIGLMIAIAASVAIGFAAVLLIQEDEYRPLFGRMDNLDAASVVQVLEQKPNQI